MSGARTRDRRRGGASRPSAVEPDRTLLRIRRTRDREAHVKRILLLVTALAALAFPVAALAHPLGNFTINRYSRIEPSGGRIYVLYVLDMAEIPTFQAQGTVHSVGTRVYTQQLAASIGRGLTLAV